MPTPADLLIARALISHQLDLMRLSAFTQTQALLLLDRMGGELEALLRKDNITAFSKARINELLRQATEAIDKYYSDVNKISSQTLVATAKVQTGAVQQSLAGIAVNMDASLPTEAFLKSLASDTIIEGATSSVWWSRQSGDTAFRFATSVRQGLVRGETNEQIVSRVFGTATQPGVIKASRSNARILVHSSVQAVANEARMEVFKNNSDIIEGVRQVSTLDGNTTEICIAYSGGEWDLDGNPLGDTELPFNGGPPRHWGCRSVLVPITKSFRELGIDIPEFDPVQRAATGGPVRGSMTMKEWLDGRTKEQLDEQLGPGRAKLFREGKITLQQLLDLRGNPLTVRQLEKRYT